MALTTFICPDGHLRDVLVSELKEGEEVHCSALLEGNAPCAKPMTQRATETA